MKKQNQKARDQMFHGILTLGFSGDNLNEKENVTVKQKNNDKYQQDKKNKNEKQNVDLDEPLDDLIGGRAGRRSSRVLLIPNDKVINKDNTVNVGTKLIPNNKVNR